MNIPPTPLMEVLASKPHIRDCFPDPDGEGMLFRVRSSLTGLQHIRILDCTESQVIAWAQGQVSQSAFPSLCPEDREFIQTGSTVEEWDQMFSNLED